MSLNIQGVLNNYKRKKILFFSDDDGNELTDAQARFELNKALNEGKKVLPCGDCYRFDDQNGCPGHIISLKPNEEKLEEIELEYQLYKQGKRI